MYIIRMGLGSILSRLTSATVTDIKGLDKISGTPVFHVRADGTPIDYPGGEHSAPLAKFFRDSGSSSVLSVDGSVTPVIFEIKPPANTVYHIATIKFIMRQSAMQWQLFGAEPELTNGLEIGMYGDHPILGPDALLSDFLDGEPVKNLSEFAVHMTQESRGQSFGGGQDLFSGNLLIHQNAGTRIVLDGDKNQSIKLTVNDNLTNIPYFRCKVIGHQYPKS